MEKTYYQIPVRQYWNDWKKLTKCTTKKQVQKGQQSRLTRVMRVKLLNRKWSELPKIKSLSRMVLPGCTLKEKKESGRIWISERIALKWQLKRWIKLQEQNSLKGMALVKKLRKV
ncbi:MAG: hypothetical protein [Microviridae sp.]|nr:MAG: hypothetical protein [Microviridae sp.]